MTATTLIPLTTDERPLPAPLSAPAAPPTPKAHLRAVRAGEAPSAHRHDANGRALITLSGEIDLATAPALRDAVDGCLRDGAQVIDVDLAAVTFCDVGGLNTFLRASESAAAAGAIFRLHFPSPMLTRLLDLTDCSRLLAHPAGGRGVTTLVARPAHPYPTAGSPGAAYAEFEGIAG
jgi:anti-anti-sigma factor